MDARRRLMPPAIIVLATVIGFVSVFALWVKRQALETETWTETSSELLEDQDISNAVADFLVDELFANVDVQGRLEQRLPAQLDPLAGPASAGLRQLAGEGAREALQQPKVQALWEDANRAAHERLLAVIDDEAPAVTTTGDAVTLDLAVIVQQLADRVGVGGDLAAKLPTGTAQVEVMSADDLDSIRGSVDALRTLAWVLTALTLGLYALAVYLARDRRREALRSVGLSLLAVGVLVLFAHGVAGNAVVGALAETAAVEPAAQASWDIGTSLLTETGQAIVIYGLVVLVAAWLAGPTATATSIRRGLAPYLRQPRFAYSGLALLLVLLFWWNPVPATDRLLPSLLLILLLALGVEMLRRQVIREFPDRVTTWSAEGLAGRLAARMREARERRVVEPPAPAPAGEESRLDQLERLAALRREGVLTDEELEAEKRRILQ
jgi:hypothetical protein